MIQYWFLMTLRSGYSLENEEVHDFDFLKIKLYLTLRIIMMSGPNGHFSSRWHNVNKLEVPCVLKLNSYEWAESWNFDKNQV